MSEAMTRATKGAWKAAGREVYADVGIRSIHVLIADCRSGGDEHLLENIANATFIAASPSMYEALKIFEQAYAADVQSEQDKLIHVARQLMRMALAQAEGREP